MRTIRILMIAVLASLMGACAAERPELDTVDYVDLDRFMGDWYVIANIPTFVEKGAHNAIETYALGQSVVTGPLYIVANSRLPLALQSDRLFVAEQDGRGHIKPAATFAVMDTDGDRVRLIGA